MQINRAYLPDQRQKPEVAAALQMRWAQRVVEAPLEAPPVGDLSDLLAELRILLPGAQTLTAFLIILPFNGGFSQIRAGEKYVYVATFLCALVSLILFAAPAAQHRLQRPLIDRERFKLRANRFVVAGQLCLSLALILATQLVLDEVLNLAWLSWSAAGGAGLLIGVTWWLIPVRSRGA